MSTVASILTALNNGSLSPNSLRYQYIVLDEEAKTALADAQFQLPPDRPCKANPVATANLGEWVLPADILTEVGEGGVYHGGFSLLGIDLTTVPVVTYDEVDWPPPTPLEEEEPA
jgi:hypothetical protein